LSVSRRQAPSVVAKEIEMSGIGMEIRLKKQ